MLQCLLVEVHRILLQGNVYQLLKCTATDRASPLLGSRPPPICTRVHTDRAENFYCGIVSNRAGGKLISRRFNKYMTVESYKRILGSC